MHRTHAQRSTLLSLAFLTALTLAVASPARAHQDPPGCTGTGLTLNIFVFFADGVNSPGAGGVVSECETLLYQGTLSFPGGGVCSFEGGKLTITTPDAVAHDVTPVGGIPKLGGTGGISGVTSLSVSYTVTAADKAAGSVSAIISYTMGKAHTGPGTSDANGVPNGSTSVPNIVEACPLGTDCTMSVCDPAKTDGGRMGLCDTTNQPDSTPCPDTDSNACTTAGCDGQGVCDQNHMTLPCPPDTNECTDDLPCDTVTGLCEHPPKTDSTPCTDTDGLACTTAGCDGQGGCDQLHIEICIPCGNGTIDTGETCDPPDPTIDPVTGQVKCRPDCTFCGDGTVQAGDGEICDDGNTVSGCDPRHPLKKLDECQNNCTPPICSDPARITMRSDMDTLDLHGRISPLAPTTTLDPTTLSFTVKLTDAAGAVVYSFSLPAGKIVGGPNRYRYVNLDAGSSGGIKRLVISRNVGAYRVTLRTYGDLSHAVANMTTHLKFGQTEWTVVGTWKKTSSGWRLNPAGTAFHF